MDNILSRKHKARINFFFERGTIKKPHVSMVDLSCLGYLIKILKDFINIPYLENIIFLIFVNR